MIRRWMIEALLRLLERDGGAADPRCLAFGGLSVDREQVRVCEKPRWHPDSHAYDWHPAGQRI